MVRSGTLAIVWRACTKIRIPIRSPCRGSSSHTVHSSQLLYDYLLFCVCRPLSLSYFHLYTFCFQLLVIAVLLNKYFSHPVCVFKLSIFLNFFAFLKILDSWGLDLRGSAVPSNTKPLGDKIMM